MAEHWGLPPARPQFCPSRAALGLSVDPVWCTSAINMLRCLVAHNYNQLGHDFCFIAALTAMAVWTALGNWNWIACVGVCIFTVIVIVLSVCDRSQVPSVVVVPLLLVYGAQFIYLFCCVLGVLHLSTAPFMAEP